MRMVEHEIRKNQEAEIVSRIQQLETKKSNLKGEISDLEEKVAELKNQQDLIIDTYDEDDEDDEDDF